MTSCVAEGEFAKCRLQFHCRTVRSREKLASQQIAVKSRLRYCGQFRCDAELSSGACHEHCQFDGVDDFQFEKPRDRQGQSLSVSPLIQKVLSKVTIREAKIEADEEVRVGVRNHLLSFL